MVRNQNPLSGGSFPGKSELKEIQAGFSILSAKKPYLSGFKVKLLIP
jgi:hypothetical protein